MQKLITLLAKPGIRYIIVGGSVYALELSVIFLAQWAGASSLWAVALAFWVGLVVSFILQKFFTFGDRRTHRKIVFAQAAAVTALVIFNFSFTLLVTKLFIHVAPVFITRTIALGITTIWNFYLYKTSIFTGVEQVAE